MDEGDAYQELRPLLFSIAYRMVGSASEAEDLVQEAFLRLRRAVAGGVEVASPKAYLSAVSAWPAGSGSWPVTSGSGSQAPT